jgi:hypothetical protein
LDFWLPLPEPGPLTLFPIASLTPPSLSLTRSPLSQPPSPLISPHRLTSIVSPFPFAFSQHGFPFSASVHIGLHKDLTDSRTPSLLNQLASSPRPSQTLQQHPKHNGAHRSRSVHLLPPAPPRRRRPLPHQSALLLWFSLM